MRWIVNEWRTCMQFYKKDVHKMTLLCGMFFIAISVILAMLLCLNKDVLSQGYTWLLSLFEGKDLDVDSISALDLFKNNSFACLYTMGMGFIPFFYVGILSLVLNALSVSILAAVYIVEDMSLLMFFAGIIPHGIFELPSIFIALALSFITCKKMTHTITGKIKDFNILQHFYHCIQIFVFIILPLLVLAACIEAYITPICMQWFM